MKYDELLANRIRKALQSVTKVEEKMMFGSLCFMVNGKMCVCLKGDKLLCRIGAQAAENAKENPGCGRMMHGKREMKHFVWVTTDVLHTNAALEYWLDLSLKFIAL